ncbi:MAG: hypothetical protein H5T86_02550 [Armatimonadetes bacterium]|nr:hypothetical protein [Armatimonadota bacterium]
MEKPCCDDDRWAGFVDDEIQDRAEQKALASHLLLCPDCAREVGHLLAHKVLTRRPDPASHAPRSLWPQIIAELDRVDGVQRALQSPAPGRRSLVPALVGIGAALIVCALIVRVVALRPVPATAQIAAMHRQVLACAGIYPGSPGTFQAVGSTFGSPPLYVVWQGIGRFGNSFVIHRLALAGRLPISIMTLPSSSLPLDQFDRRVVRGKVYFVAQTPDTAVVVMPGQGMTYVVAAASTVDDILSVCDDVVRRAAALR